MASRDTRFCRRTRGWHPPLMVLDYHSNSLGTYLSLALLRRYGIAPYRYPGQRYTTVMAGVPKRFVDETLWPEFQQLNAELTRYMNAVTDRIIKAAVFPDDSDAETRSAPAALPPAGPAFEG